MSHQEASWDLDSDEIASIASDELHENRPNRWKGAKSTWRHVTEEERILWRSMKQLQDENLGVHLYNAFALKKRAANPETARDLVMQTDDGLDGVWAPPKMWTAWPMRQKHLPPEGLFKDEGDGDDQFTFRRKEASAPSSELRSELTATILRLAKERFSRRKPPQEVRQSIETATSARSDYESSDSSSDESNIDSSSRPVEEQASDVLATDDGEPGVQNRKKADITFDPVVSADDALSASLLKPSVQHILSQLDKTLTVLHNTRVAGLSYLSDSSETETEDESDNSHTSNRKRGRGRPRLPPTSASATSPATPKPRRGRPKLVQVPEPGETQEQMELRLARRGHRRLPQTETEREAAFEDWLRQGDERVLKEQRMLSSRPVSEEPESQYGGEGGRTVGGDEDTEEVTNAERRIRRWGLRDWSDVIGAAALAGFPPDVIGRATQRCADLFRESMTLARLDEVPAARPGHGVRTTTYQPERIRLSASASDSDADDDTDDEREREATLKQRRLASRQASLAQASREASSTDTPRRGRHGLHRSSVERSGFAPSSPRTPQSRRGISSPPSRSRSRSRSRSQSTAGIVYCPLTWCDRAATGFSRRSNLQRHMRLVHPDHDADATAAGAGAAAVAMEEDSEDETVGAVHVDGFLRTVKPGKGWRGEDIMRRKRPRGTRPSTPTNMGSPSKKMYIASSGDSE